MGGRRRTRDGQGDAVIVDGGFGLGTETGAERDEVHELTGDGDFAFGLFGERNADGVTNALGKQGADAYGTLDTTVLAFTSFCDAEVQGVVHVLLVHRFHQQADGGDHDNGVRGLNTDDYVVEVLTPADAQKLHAALNDALGGITIARHDAIAE